MEVEDGASGLATWVLIPPFSDARLEGVLQFQRDYTLCQDAGEGNASNSGGLESSSSWLLKTGVFFILSDILWGALEFGLLVFSSLSVLWGLVPDGNRILAFAANSVFIYLAVFSVYLILI